MSPASIAIVGDSPTGRGGAIHRQLVELGFKGPIFPVHPKLDEVYGLRAYKSLAELPQPVEFVAVALAAKSVPAVLREAISLGARAGLAIASGFSEAGDEGIALQAEVTELCTSSDFLLCGPNCYGVANLIDGFVSYSGPISEGMQPGEIALVFQSGALTHGVTDPVVSRGIGYSHIVTTGNEAVVGLPDYIDYLIDDGRVKVIACFVEGFRSMEDFERVARRAVERGVRIVVLKTGRSDSGRRAALAHTGALVGSDSAIDAWLRKIGVTRVFDLDELVETALLLSKLPPKLPDGAPAIASISGGGSGVMADLAADVSLTLADFAEDTREALTAALPSFASINNPLDFTGAVGEDPLIMDRALGALSEAPEVNMIAWALNTPVISTERGKSSYRNTVSKLGQFNGVNDKPVVAFTMTSGTVDSGLVEEAAKYDLPIVQGMRAGMVALERAIRSSRSAAWVRDPDAVAGERPASLDSLLRSGGDGILSEREMKEALGSAGVRVTREILALTADEAAQAATKIGYPVAMKVESPDIAHKNDVGGVRLGVEDEDSVRAAFESILTDIEANARSARVDGILVQEMAGEGHDIFVGAVYEPGIGPVLALGAGGVLVEVIDQVSTAVCPLLPDEALEFVKSSPAAGLLRARRGEPAGDIEALAEAVAAVSRLAWWLGKDLVEFDVNPIRVFSAGNGAMALDGFGRIAAGRP